MGVRVIRMRRQWLAAGAAALLLLALSGGVWLRREVAETAGEDTFIKWVDFNVPYSVLERAIKLDIASQETEQPLCWIDLLAYAACECGNRFSGYAPARLDAAAERLCGGESMESLTRSMPYFAYYRRAYTAALGGLVGEFEEEDADGVHWRYGLKAWNSI